jgi:HK97 family phage major capsid protein
VPRNLVVGTSGATTSDIFTADWSQLYIGVRIALRVEVLKERFMTDSGSYAFLGWWRGDIQVARPKAFDVVTGVKP